MLTLATTPAGLFTTDAGVEVMLPPMRPGALPLCSRRRLEGKTGGAAYTVGLDALINPFVQLSLI